MPKILLSSLFRFIERHAPVLLAGYLTLLLVATHYPKVVVPAAGIQGDKIVHLLAYACLSLLVAMVLGRRTATVRPGLIVAGVAIVVAIGALDELTQPLPMFNRVGDFWDWLADSVGAMAGAGVYVWARRWGLLKGGSVVGRRGPEVAQVD
jgi:VanZ family protein